MTIIKRINILLVGLFITLPGLAQQKDLEPFRYSGQRINLQENTFKCKHIGKWQGVTNEGYQGMDI